ncbi:group II intron reverse transcriptase [Legionella sp.]|uniref:group II intron reverse transcriptase n=1 Tax=Legionella sp. TaxID=459 RepID=UPI0039E4CFEA
MKIYSASLRAVCVNRSLSRSPRLGVPPSIASSKRKGSAQWVLEADIKACFDTIAHDWLLKWIPMDKRILAQWLKAGYVDKRVLYPSNQGTPQGGIISPLLANLTLDGLERTIKLQFKRGKVHVIRYADDFIITGNSKELLENKVQPAVEKFLAPRELTLSKEKTHITPIQNGFDFLGFNFRKLDSKLRIQPAKKKIKEIRSKIKTIIKTHQQAKTGTLITNLNPIIRGWANYYRHCKSKQVFSYLDHQVFILTWRWANRRHPNKGKRWIKKQYFRVTPHSAWTFCGTTPDTKSISLRLFRETFIKLHIKIRSEVNPYDPQYGLYLEQRKTRDIHKSEYSKYIQKFLLRQKHSCPICHEELNQQTGWHLHHLTRRRDGGKNHRNNLVLLHPTCHEQWHSRNRGCVTGPLRREP